VDPIIRAAERELYLKILVGMNQCYRMPYGFAPFLFSG
jgi:hypothetical protein